MSKTALFQPANQRGNLVTPEDLKTIHAYPFKNPSETKIAFSEGEGETGVRFAAFCDQLKKAAPHIAIKHDSDLPFEAPVLVSGRNANIVYHTLPTGKMLPLFLESLDSPLDAGAFTGETTEPLLQSIDLPAEFKLYVADQCPHCPQTLRQLQALADAYPMIRLRVINAEGSADMARDDKIKSVPTLILDDRFRWTGQVKTEELLTICADRDPSSLSADSLRQLVEDGQAPQVAAMMTESGQLFPALIDLLVHPRWSVRLGAMVTVEYLTDDAPDLGRHLCRSLWQTFPDLTIPVQGDVTHIFGLLNDPQTRGYLQTIIKGDFDDEVRKAAAEALDEMA
jgi:thiol-disulfide isomerase/thioredoxin